MDSSSLPAAFMERLAAIVPPDKLAAVQQSFTRDAATGFRVNRLLTEVEPVLNALRDVRVQPNPVDWADDCFWVPAPEREALTHSPLVNAGKLYVLDLASPFIASLVGAQPGEEVLDLAAAPGGKTLCLAAAMENRGRLAAVEAVKGRFFQLKQNVECYGATVVDAYLKDGRQVGRRIPGRFDRVLLDAPCSSESRFNVRDPASFQFWSEKKIRDMQRKQKQLLYSAVGALKPGGRLVYSTCSYAPEENEVVVDRQLTLWAEQLRVVPLEPPLANVQPGLTQWRNKQLNPQLQHALRILPDGLMGGFFACVLEKLPETHRQ